MNKVIVIGGAHSLVVGYTDLSDMGLKMGAQYIGTDNEIANIDFKYLVFFSSFKKFNNSENHPVFFSQPLSSPSNYWLNTILFSNRKECDEFLKFISEKKIMTRSIWALMNKLEMFQDCQTDGLGNAKWIEERVVNMPNNVRVL